MKKVLSAFLLFCALSIQATDLRIVPQTGEEQTYDISRIGRLVFRDTRLQLLDHSGNLIAEEETGRIRKIVFAQGNETAVEEVAADAVTVYPNPAAGMLYIRGIAEDTPVGIYTTDGKKVYSSTGSQCSVHGLPAGTYLLQIGTQVIRFIKQ